MNIVIVLSFKFLSKTAAAILLIFTLRRWLFTLTAWLTPRPAAACRLPPAACRLPPILLLVPARNEAPNLPALLAALANLDYPAQQLVCVFVDDASEDESAALMARWSAGRPNWHVLSLPARVGKASALNAALARYDRNRVYSENPVSLIAVYDADERPSPDALRRLAAHFADPRVGAVSGRRVVANPLAGPAASHAAFEALVHQEITACARDRLALAPPILGSNCAYRRSALHEVGLFRPGALLEDSDLTLRLALAGWQTRFAPEAISAHAAPATVAGYWRQHARWSRGFYNVAGHHLPALLTQPGLPLPLRLELLAFSAGYLDRVALLLALTLLLAGRDRRRVSRIVAASLLTPLLQIFVALRLARAPRRLIRQIVWLPLFFALDLTIAATSLVTPLLFAPLERLNILRVYKRLVVVKRRHVTAHHQTGE